MSSSLVVMTREAALKPVLAVMRLTNSSESSTLDSSSEPARMVPAPEVPAVETTGLPELFSVAKRVEPTWRRPWALAKVATGMRPRVRLSPLVKAPVMVPSSPTVKSWRLPMG